MPLITFIVNHFDWSQRSVNGRNWLKTAIQSPEFRTAKHRIVLNHYPATKAKGGVILEIFDGIFTGKDRLLYVSWLL